MSESHERNAPPPPPLDYRAAKSERKPPARREVQFIVGIGTGTLVSFVIWWFYNDIARTSPIAAAALSTMLVGLPLVKIVVSTLLIVSPRLRAAGVGLLISLPVGVLIFFGSCAAH